MHDARCPRCSQVLGTDNTCEHCHALVPALRRGTRIVCSACGSERRRAPNTIVVSERELRFVAGWQRVRIRIYKIVAILSTLFALLLGSIFFRYAPDGFLFTMAMVISLISVSVAGFSLHRIKRARTHGQLRESFALEQRLLGLAHRQAGVVTAEEAARYLNVPVAAADAMLDELAHRGQAEIDVTDRGEIRFLLGPGKKAMPGTSTTRGAAAAARKQRQQT